MCAEHPPEAQGSDLLHLLSWFQPRPLCDPVFSHPCPLTSTCPLPSYGQGRRLVLEASFTSSHPGLCSFSPHTFKTLFDPSVVSFASISLKHATVSPNLLLQRREVRPPPEPPEARRPPVQKSPVPLVKTDEAPAGRHPQTEQGQNRLLDQKKRPGRWFKLWLFPPAQGKTKSTLNSTWLGCADLRQPRW